MPRFIIIIEVIFLVLSLILAFAWIADPNRNCEPYLAVCGLVFILTEIIRRAASNKKTTNYYDITLFERYKSLFVENGVAEFYRQHDFLGSFKEEFWRPLSDYIDTWNTPDHEFADKQLQKAHKDLYEKAEKLGFAIAKYTVPIGKEGHLRSVKPDSLPPGPTPEHIKNEAKEINALVPGFFEAHSKFIRLANQKLY